jgi:hypothetical protein
MRRSPASHRLLLLVVAGTVAATTTGCSIIDRLFLLNADGPYAHGARHHGGACRPGEGGACQDCEAGCPDGRCETAACQDCPHHGAHVGRYGGLAKHHLSGAEKAMLDSSDYGAVTPAGPPTGAVAYPYYTTRGPRDFLAKCPPSIGP